MKPHLMLFGLAVVACAGAVTSAQAQAPTRFEVLLPASAAQLPVTGRLIVVVSRTESPEPRLTANYRGSPVFGVDVDQLKPGQTAVLDDKALGYPLDRLEDLPPGDYYAQAILNVYREFKRSDGHTVWLPPRAEGLPFQLSPGNLYSEIAKIRITSGQSFVAKLELSKVVPPVDPPKDTVWIKQVRIKSGILSKFWGSPVYLGASVLLPKGYDEHPNARYPVAYVHQFTERPFFFNPAPESQKDDAELKDGNLQTGYEFYQSWTSDDFPRFIGVSFHQASPYFPDAYSVNSANNGPYGDALMQELIPYLEKHFRAIGKPYARVLEGASTGGWETLALMLYHPDFFGGAWVFNPDPIDFHRDQLVNAYEDDNAFCAPESGWRCYERPMRRTTEGQVTDTVRSMSRFEAVLGSRGRSGYQFNAWEAVYGPVGPDGYPVPLWDKLTGKINHEVAEYMRSHGYDLTEYAGRNWPALGPKLTGKLNVFSGEMDNFYLDLAVYRFQDFLRSTRDPHDEGRFEFGRPMKGHNWHPYHFADMLREMAEHIKKAVPEGEDTAQWNY